MEGSLRDMKRLLAGIGLLLLLGLPHVCWAQSGGLFARSRLAEASRSNTPRAVNSNFDPYSVSESPRSSLLPPVDLFAFQVSDPSIPPAIPLDPQDEFPPTLDVPPPPGFEDSYSTYEPFPSEGLFAAESPPPAVLVPRPRNLQKLDFTYTFLPAFSDGELGINQFDWSATFARTLQGPFRIRPGFRLNLWQGPDNVPLPPQTYDAYVDFGVTLPVTQRFLVDLQFKPSYSSDFSRESSDNFNFPGRGVGIFVVNERLQIIGGLAYTDLSEVSFLPIGGVIWQANPDLKINAVFPKATFHQRLRNWRYADTYWYGGGEFFGGRWGITRDDGVADVMEYDDIRIFTGLEWRFSERKRLFAEIGFAFERDLRLRNFANQTPDETLLFRTGFSF